MTEQLTILSRRSLMLLIVSIIGWAMMAAIIWGPFFSANAVSWYFPPDLLDLLDYLLFFGGGAIVYLVFSLPAKWNMIKCSLPIGIWGILTLILILSSAAVFFAFLPLVLTDFASMGWFGIIWVLNGNPTLIASTTWPIRWIWWFWTICYSTFVIEMLLIVVKLVQDYRSHKY